MLANKCLLLPYRQEQKRGLIQQQLQATPEKSDRQMAKDLGTSHPTVAKCRKTMEDSGQLERFTSSIGADGKERPRQVERKPVSVFNPTKREEKALTNPKVVEQVNQQGIREVRIP